MMKSTSLFVLCIRWILITIISNSIAMAYGFSLIEDSKSTWHEGFLKGLFLGGLLSGLGQWILLKARLKGTRSWILINALGVPLGLVLGNFLYSAFFSLNNPISKELAQESTDTAYLFAVTCIAGMVLGTLQWFILKNKVGLAYLWIPVSFLSWSAGLYLVYAFFGPLDLGSWNDVWSISGAVYGGILGGIVGTMGSIAIGFMLARSNDLLKQIETPAIRDAS